MNSIYHTAIFNHGDGLILTDTVSWSYAGGEVFVENHGDDRTGQLTWGTLADTMLGVGAFLEAESCWSAQWIIRVEGLGNIGSWFVGAKVDSAQESTSTLAGTVIGTI